MGVDDLPNFARQVDWRDVPENAEARQDAYRPRGWVEQLAQEWDRHGDQAFSALYHSLLEDLAQCGLTGIEASRAAAAVVEEKLEQRRARALRATWLAVVEVLVALRNLTPVKQEVAAKALGVSTRTLQSDIARVQKLLADGSVRRAARRPLPPVPVPAGARLGLPLSRRPVSRRRSGH